MAAASIKPTPPGSGSPPWLKVPPSSVGTSTPSMAASFTPSMAARSSSSSSSSLASPSSSSTMPPPPSTSPRHEVEARAAGTGAGDMTESLDAKIQSFLQGYMNLSIDGCFEFLHMLVRDYDMKRAQVQGHMEQYLGLGLPHALKIAYAVLFE